MPPDSLVLLVFGIVYLCMMLGKLPGLALDRTGVALLGAIALVVAGRFSLDNLGEAVDVPTIMLLLALMVLSAQFRLSGFYTYAVRQLATLDIGPQRLLALLIVLAGLLSALLANDIVCLAMTPVLVECCARRGLNPLPFLLGLACASNVGSATTLIGNPQNMLIGEVLKLSFTGYLGQALVPAGLGLAVVWGVLCRQYRNQWRAVTPLPTIHPPPYSSWQSTKGFAVLAGVVGLFLFSPWPRELVALAGAGVLLCSRRMRSREILGLVDWQLILLFISLFVLNQTMVGSGNLTMMTDWLAAAGVHLERPVWLFGVTALLSNLVSNVPAVMLLLPSATHPQAGAVLALSSTLAGNLLVVGSIANIIVIDQAARLGVAIDWRTHARTGLPVTLITLALAAGWLVVGQQLAG